MLPARNTLTPLRLSIIGIRLIVILMFTGSLAYIGYLLVGLVKRHSEYSAMTGPYAAMVLVYAIVMFFLLFFPGPIARALAKGLPRFAVRSHWSRVELVAAIIAGAAMFEMLSAIPSLLTQLYDILYRYPMMLAEGAADRDRFNFLVVGTIGAVLRIGVSGLVFVKSGRISAMWDRWQTRDGLTKR